ncbi:MAG: prolyl oligopeptidase family serine peptidase, partial [Deltaproteobacteria bacterium]|nr:prolyl oligopeptidase family serine peptidase [Deltaproteobacteria bacterium]
KTHERIRAKDSIHLTEKGAKIIVDSFLPRAADWGLAGFPKSAPAAGSASESAAGDGPATASGAVSPRGPAENAPGAGENPGDSNSGPRSGPGSGATDGISPAAGGRDDDSAENPAPNAKDASATRAEPPFSLSLPMSAPPPVSPATLLEVNLPSKARGGETNYAVYLPGPEVERPTLFLLHGVGEDYLIWKDVFGRELLNLAQTLDVNLVMPDGDFYGWYLDSDHKKNSKMESYLMEELWPDLSQRFPFDPERVGALGISMGGHGVLTLALKHPGRFKAVSSLSGITDLELHGPRDPWHASLNIAEVLGPHSSRTRDWRNNSAYHLTRMSPRALENTKLFLTVGKSDPIVLAENRQYHRLLTDLDLDHVYSEDSGDHSWDLWREKVPEHLALLAAGL